MRNTGSVPFVDGKSEIPCFMDVFLVYYLYTFFCFLFGDAVIPSIEGNSALCSVPVPSHLC